MKDFLKTMLIGIYASSLALLCILLATVGHESIQTVYTGIVFGVTGCIMAGIVIYEDFIK